MFAFGLVNGGYASLVTWLAPYYQSKGWSATSSDSLVAAMATDDPFSWKREVHLDPQPFAVEIIEHVRQPERPTVS